MKDGDQVNKTKEAFGDWAFKQRETLGVSRKTLGAKIGISTEYIRLVEIGRRRPSNPVRVALEAALRSKTVDPEAKSSLILALEEEIITANTCEFNWKRTAEAIAERIISEGWTPNSDLRS
jgi:ribosome-binding protein aMBF1 (putative translation factor)